MKTIIIDDSMLNQIRELASKSLNREICGIITGKKVNDVVVCKELIQVNNIADREKQQIDYMMNPNEVMEVLKDTTMLNKESEKDFVAIWHTHPFGSSKPSSIDLMRAEYNVAYIIFGMASNTIESFSFIKKENERFFKSMNMVSKEKLLIALK